LREQSRLKQFEQAIFPHLDAAYNLARWLTRNEQDAEDIVQEACLRAFKFFDNFRGDDGRPWLLTIVRNTYYTWWQHEKAHEITTPFDEEHDSISSEALNPEAIFLQNIDNQLLKQALECLPVEFREVLVLRELEGLSYKQIAHIINIPLGTAMSRLARARKRLQLELTNRVLDKEL
jgi:RNA polymerase sigma factor (sigma-70 family)